jgi:lysophospholipase L1-like esterase
MPYDETSVCHEDRTIVYAIEHISGEKMSPPEFKLRRLEVIRHVACVAAMAFALSACGEGSGQSNDGGGVIIPPVAAPSPTPTPIPGEDAIVVPAACTIDDSVLNRSDLQIAPVNGSVLAVAIGSSSTAGNGASSPSNGYVAVTQRLLAGYTGLAKFVVVNAGVPGDSLAQVRSRLQRDALAMNPQLVILQVGVNDATAQPTRAGVDAFRVDFADTVTQIRRKSQLIIVTGQHYQRQPAFYEDYMNAMTQVADQQDVAVFDRYKLMKGLISSGKYSFGSLLAGDLFHPNDVMHRCTGKVLADLVAASVTK